MLKKGEGEIKETCMNCTFSVEHKSKKFLDGISYACTLQNNKVILDIENVYTVEEESLSDCPIGMWEEN